MSYYFWLGHDAEPPEADERAQYEIEDRPRGFTATLIVPNRDCEPIEDDGFITIIPNLNR